MAKLGEDPNSATSQFFINLSNNSAGSARLDTENGGYSVFGQVLGNGMDIVEQIAALPRFGYSSPFAELPLRNFSQTDALNGVTPTDENLVIITDIVVIDATVSTNTNLNPAANTLINNVVSPTQPSSNSGGGSFSALYISLLSLLCVTRRRYTKAKNNIE